MMRSNEVGRVRIELAEILRGWCKENVSPSLLVRNYADYRSSKKHGYAFSWHYDAECVSHPLFGIGCAITMTEFVRLYRGGLSIAVVGGEILLVA